MNPAPTPATGDVWREVIDGPGRLLPADLRAAMEARWSAPALLWAVWRWG